MPLTSAERLELKRKMEEAKDQEEWAAKQARWQSKGANAPLHPGGKRTFRIKIAEAGTPGAILCQKCWKPTDNTSSILAKVVVGVMRKSEVVAVDIYENPQTGTTFEVPVVEEKRFPKIVKMRICKTCFSSLSLDEVTTKDKEGKRSFLKVEDTTAGTSYKEGHQDDAPKRRKVLNTRYVSGRKVAKA